MRHAESLCDQISNERAVAHFVAKQVHWGGPDKFRWKSDFNHIMPKVGSGRFGGNRANTSRDIYGEAMFLANTRFWPLRAIAIGRAAPAA